MIALAAQQTLIPSAACFDISYGDEGLRTHAHQPNNSVLTGSGTQDWRRGGPIKFSQRGCLFFDLENRSLTVAAQFHVSR